MYLADADGGVRTANVLLNASWITRAKVTPGGISRHAQTTPLHFALAAAVGVLALAGIGGGARCCRGNRAGSLVVAGVGVTGVVALAVHGDAIRIAGAAVLPPGGGTTPTVGGAVVGGARVAGTTPQSHALRDIDAEDFVPSREDQVSQVGLVEVDLHQVTDTPLKAATPPSVPSSQDDGVDRHRTILRRFTPHAIPVHRQLPTTITSSLHHTITSSLHHHYIASLHHQVTPTHCLYPVRCIVKLIFEAF